MNNRDIVFDRITKKTARDEDLSIYMIEEISIQRGKDSVQSNYLQGYVERKTERKRSSKSTGDILPCFNHMDNFLTFL